MNKRRDKINSKKLFLFSAIVIALIGGFIYINNKLDKGQKDPGFEPLIEYGKVLEEENKHCPLLKIDTDLDLNVETSDFKILGVRCSAEANNIWNIVDGEEVEVEIHTQNFEQGKLAFKDWLKSKRLTESPTLRITYEHKPQ